MSIGARIIDGLFWVIGTLLLRKAFPKLTENAVTGWIDDKIGAYFGWSAPDVSTVLDWVWPAAVVALVLWGYHEFYSRFIRRPSVAIYTIKQPTGAALDNIISQIPHHLYAQVSVARSALGLKVVIAWVLIIGCGTGLTIGIALLASSKQSSIAKVDHTSWNHSAQPPPVATLPLAQEPPTIPTVIYTERDIRELLDALADANELVEKKFSQTIYAITNATANWRGAIPNRGVQGFADDLKTMREGLQENVWRPLNHFVYETHSGYKDQLRAALALDHEAAKGELTRSLQVAIDAVERLPDNPSQKTMELVAPQFAEAYKQAELLYNWLSEARARISGMRDNLRTRGRTGYEKG
jgi:hypothetical protein